ncbi:hypothetical protein SSU05_1827 [Streptococcus suis 05ZYH33]|nr:hypothetical protein SSU05_1827 [Streptococcus suis 05ZYH33]
MIGANFASNFSVFFASYSSNDFLTIIAEIQTNTKSS